MTKSKVTKKDIVKDDDYNTLEFMLNLIPPIFYFDDEYKNIIRNTDFDLNSTKLNSSKNVNKYTNPLQCLSVSDIQSEIQIEYKDEDKHIFARPNTLSNGKHENTRKRINSTSDINEEILEKKCKNDSESDSEVENISDEEDAGLGSSIDSYDLHDLLHSRIEALQAKRKHVQGDDALLEKKRLSRRLSKMKLKLRRKQSQKHNKERTPALEKIKKEVVKQKPIFNKEGKMVFSKFDFGKDVGTIGSKQNKKEVNAMTGKNFKQILQTVEKRKERIEKLKTEGKFEKASNIEKKQQWNAALQKAEGIKLKDNTELLKKSIKRKEQIVNKKSKEWNERIGKVKEKSNEKIKKREKNMSERKKGVAERKIKKSKAKGRYIPGF